ncbi:PUR family DNA/RNA-binding protein [Bacteroides sp.]
MEDLKKKGADMNDKEIVFSKSIKAGKRIYYLDVKKNRKDEMFLAITESKKVVTGEGEDAQVSFEKHKIFLYREDFEKFMNGLNEAINFINQKEMLEVIGDMNAKADAEHVIDADADANIEATLETIAEMNEKGMELDGEIKIDIDFEEPTL